MKITAKVKELQELQNKCMTMDCDYCILSMGGTCEVYSLMQYIEELSRIEPDMETTIDI